MQEDTSSMPVRSQFSIPVLRNLCPEAVVVRVQFPLGWNTYLFFNSHIVNFVWETDEILWGCFNCRWVRVEVDSLTMGFIITMGSGILDASVGTMENRIINAINHIKFVSKKGRGKWDVGT